MVSKKEKSDWWPSEGSSHRDVTREGIYLNEKIRRFLDSDRVSLVIANKGMGKTLLMRVKKNLLISEQDGLLVIPSDKTEFDEPGLHSAHSRHGYSDLSFWKELWSTSILLSILSYVFKYDENKGHRGFLRNGIASLDIDEDFRRSFLENTIEQGKFSDPSYYLETLLSGYSESQLQKLFRTTFILDDLSKRYITNGVVVLIDACDQALRRAFLPENIEAWKFGQLGLAKAAHSLFTTNHHIKVIATIRQEAWAAFIDDDRQVIEGKSLILDYSPADLRALFDKAVLQYSSKKSIQQFLGVNDIFNEFHNAYEDPFNYIYRHSTGSPRSLMIFGRELALAGLLGLPEAERQEEIRDQVDRVAAESSYKDYLLGQMTSFLKTLTGEERIRELLNLIPSNVFTASSLKSINDKFCQNIGVRPEKTHPFCELFNIGLLGRVQQNTASSGEFQYFRKLHEFDWKQENILTENAIYLLHPGLTSQASNMHNININRLNIIGTGRKWINKDGHFGIPKIFISHSSNDKPLLEEKLLPSLEHKLNLKFPSDFWLDKWKIHGGDDIYDKIESGVAEADIVVLFASKASLASGWVEKEWKTKLAQEIRERDIRLIVAIIDETTPNDLPAFLQNKLAVIILESDLDGSIEKLAAGIAKSASKLLLKRCAAPG
jgi:hypothetical protein